MIFDDDGRRQRADTERKNRKPLILKGINRFSLHFSVFQNRRRDMLRLSGGSCLSDRLRLQKELC